ncbi:MAG: HIT family protein [Chloroflexi bacterium]|nr:HIT family protein [Chloroflexota bacterium]
MRWPERFYQIRRGEGCPLCEEGRPDAHRDGVRFYAGEVTDAYLRRSPIQRGLTVVVWRGRHVAEPTELTVDEAAKYWQELLAVGRAIEQALQPVKLNYNLLGNAVPHLHTHVVPRYADDPRPGWPFPFPEEEPPAMPEDVLRADVEALRAALRSARPQR